MQRTANATNIIARIYAQIRAAQTAQATHDTFSVYVPGEGTSGIYETIAEAEEALNCLPFSTRRRAVICDQDGNCIVR